LKKAIDFSSRRRAASKSSQLANLLVGEGLRQILVGGLQPAMGLMSPSLKHIVLGVVLAGTMQFGGILLW
jgi:hypothetical protein